LISRAHHSSMTARLMC